MHSKVMVIEGEETRAISTPARERARCRNLVCKAHTHKIFSHMRFIDKIPNLKDRRLACCGPTDLTANTHLNTVTGGGT